jgi:circadian clock protein KaiA
MALSSSAVSRPQLSICSLLSSKVLAQDLIRFLDGDRYAVVHLLNQGEFLDFVKQGKHEIDCFILEKSPELPKIARDLHQEPLLLPAVILVPETARAAPAEVTASSLAVGSETTISTQKLDNCLLSPESTCFYHTVEVQLSTAQLTQITASIDQAIAQFLKFSPACPLPIQESSGELASMLAMQSSLALQQRRLSEKLKERLGYLGIYYKRNPQYFFRHLPESKKQQLMDELKSNYQEILLNYFRQESVINQKIDEFVTQAFFADLSVSQVLEIHMELMDEFAKQLKLEGRSEDILLDYRLTLIDTIAHLCEMYRRSIPREP